MLYIILKNSLAQGFEFSKGKVILLDTFSDNKISSSCKKRKGFCWDFIIFFIDDFVLIMHL